MFVNKPRQKSADLWVPILTKKVNKQLTKIVSKNDDNYNSPGFALLMSLKSWGDFLLMLKTDIFFYNPICMHETNKTCTVFVYVYSTVVTLLFNLMHCNCNQKSHVVAKT